MASEPKHGARQRGKRLSPPNPDPARLWRIPLNTETEPSRVETALRERIKELNCLYGIAQLSERHMDSLEKFLQELVNFLPFSWQYPEVACARVEFKGRTYRSNGFKITKWRQSSQVLEYNEPAGELSVFYLEARPPADEGPFLKEERALIDAVAERIGTLSMRISAELELQETNRQLTVERTALQETNAALRTVLSRIEEEKKEIHRDLRLNIEKIIMPILHSLLLEAPKAQRKYVEMLRDNLEEIASPFVRELSRTCLALTPTEVAICNMIRGGLRTKEIAELRGVSLATVHRHREHIRRKLGITNDDVNLATFLQSGMWQVPV